MVQNVTKMLLKCYKDGKNVRPLCVMFPKMNVYRKDFDETKYVFLYKR